jgi:hypothetical protein
LAYNNLLDDPLDSHVNRFGQRTATAAAMRSIVPLDEFTAAATNLLPHLIHDVTS